MHLLDERRDTLESSFSAQPLEEAQAQLGSVEVAVEVDQEGLDQLRPAGTEGRAHADRDRRRYAIGQARVDAVARAHNAVGRDQVGRREAEIAAAPVAGDDLRAQLEWLTE